MKVKIKDLNIFGLVPARGGSKGIPGKNTRLLNGKPLLAYSIEHGLESKYINKVVCSTDDEKIADIARTCGAEVPFLRPAKYATDEANDAGFTRHAIEFLRDNEDYKTDLVVLLRPTSPLRKPQDIDKAIEKLCSVPEAHSIKTVIASPYTPYKMWRPSDSGHIVPLLTCDVSEPYNAPRQQLPVVYWQNGYIDIVRAGIVLRDNSVHGFKILPYIMESSEYFDLDTEKDFVEAEKRLRQNG